MLVGNVLQIDREVNLTGADDVLDLEIRELHLKPQLLNNARVLARCDLRRIFVLGACADHLAGAEDQSSRFRLLQTHYNCGEASRVVLRVAGLEGDVLKIEGSVEVDSRHNIPY